MHSNTREEIKEVRAGDIAAAVGLKDVTTGDTLCDVSSVITPEKMEFPEPVISVAVEPKSTEDESKMGLGYKSLRKRIHHSGSEQMRNLGKQLFQEWESST